MGKIDTPYLKQGTPRLLSASGNADGATTLVVDLATPDPGKYFITEYMSVYFIDPAFTTLPSAIEHGIFINSSTGTVVDPALPALPSALGIDAADRGIPIGNLFGTASANFGHAFFGYKIFNQQKLLIPYGSNLRYTWGETFSGVFPSNKARAVFQALVRQFDLCDCE